MSTQVAETILSQLGGRRFIAMTGAKSFAGGPDQLTFRLPSTLTRDHIKAVKIQLDPSDTYTVTFYAGAKFPECIRTVATVSDVYCDRLCDVFESATGLRVSL